MTAIGEPIYSLNGQDINELEVKDAGTYQVKVDYASTSYTGTVMQTITINPKEITVTPRDGQFVYKEEDKKVEFDYTGNVIGEVPAFGGSLVWGTHKVSELETEYIIQRNSEFTLIDNESGYFKASNYTLKFIENVTYTYYDMFKQDTEASTPEGVKPNENGWYNQSPIKITAPDGYTFEDGSKEKEFGDGTHNYTIKDMYGTTYPHEIKIDNKVPVIEHTINYTTAIFTITDAVSDITTSGIASCLIKDGDTELTVPTFEAGAQKITFTYEGTPGKHTLKFTVKDMAGNTLVKEIEFTLTSKPYYPPYYPPTVSYYDVILPEIVGVTTSPKAGTHEVRGGYNFEFTITLDDDYNESVPVVTLDNGETITPNSEGKYIIRSIWDDVEIIISGIKPNDPTANERVEVEHSKIWKANGMLHILPAVTGKGYLVTMDGAVKRVLNLKVGMEEQMFLETGVYILMLPDVRLKLRM